MSYILLSYIVLAAVIGALVRHIILSRRRNETQALVQQVDHQHALDSANMEVEENVLRYISGELHDNIGQVLSLVQLKLLHITDAGTRDLRMVGEIGECALLLRQANSDLRNLSHDYNRFRPAAGLSGSVKQILAMLSATHKIACQLHQSGQEQLALDTKQELSAFRITQEALNNIFKHARATAIDVYLDNQADQFILTVKDNGIGFDLADSNKGIGLSNMRQRAAMLGGDLQILTAAGKGTTIRFTLKNDAL